MTGDFAHSYLFKSFRLNIAERQLLCKNSPVYLTPKAFDVLALLVEQNGHLVEKDELLKQVWADSFVEEANIARIIHTLRKTLGEDGNGNKFIETVATKGYRFVAEVTEDRERPERHADKLEKPPVVEEDFPDSIEVNEPAEPLHGRPVSGSMPRSHITESGGNAIVNLAEWRNVVNRVEEQKDPLVLVPNDNVVPPVTGEQEAERPQNFSQKIKLGRKTAIAVVAILFVASVATSYYFFKSASAPIVFQAGEIKRLTSNGRVASAAFSPDGQFIVYAQKEIGDQQSLWMQRIGNDNALQVAPPANIEYRGLVITPDGNTFYYTDGQQTLYQMGVLGGRVRKIAENVGRRRGQRKIAISPDGKEIAFARRNEAGESAMIVMNADGTNERTLTAFDAAISIDPKSTSWSPDGKVIACTYGWWRNDGVMGIQTADGKYAPILAPTWLSIYDIAWLPDSQSLAIAGTSFTDVVEEVGPQIWQIPYPAGERRRITKDSNSYVSLGIAADGSLIALRTDENALIETTNDDGGSEPKRLTAGSEKQDGVIFLDWLPDGRIVFDSWASEKYFTLALEQGGANTKQLASSILGRAISNDGNTLIFTKLNFEGMWSMDLRTGSERRLLPDESAWVDFTPDDKWIVFAGSDGEKSGLVKMPVEGGEPTLLSQGYAIPVVSPDGKIVAFTGAYWGMAIALVSIDGGNIIRKFEVGPEIPEFSGKRALQWTPDGRAINYIALNNLVSNIWRQPIDGGPPVQITKFETGRIFNFAYSRDGTQLALSRGTRNSDVVLIKNSN